MSTYRVEWPCCGSVTETEAWKPDHCPFCHDDKTQEEKAATELLEAARNAERLLEIAEEQAKCKAERIKLGWLVAGEDGLFGIAVKGDPAALRWQELERVRNALIAANRAAIAKALGETS